MYSCNDTIIYIVNTPLKYLRYIVYCIYCIQWLTVSSKRFSTYALDRRWQFNFIKLQRRIASLGLFKQSFHFYIVSRIVIVKWIFFCIRISNYFLQIRTWFLIVITLCCILYIVPCTLHCVQCRFTLYTIQCILYNVHCTMHMCSVHVQCICTMYMYMYSV